MKIPKNCKIEKCASTDPERVALAHPAIRTISGRKALVATDGRKMVALFDVVKPEDADGCVPAAAIAALRKSRMEVHANGSIPVQGVDFSRPLDQFVRGEACEQVGIGDKQFSEAKGEAKLRIALDARLLLDIAEAMGTEHVILTFRDELSPILVEAPKIPEKVSQEKEDKIRAERSLDCRGILMPVRIS